MNASIAPTTHTKEEPSDGYLPGSQLDSYGYKSWETPGKPDLPSYLAEHSRKLTARFAPMKRRSQSMARFIAERLESLPADSLEREKLKTVERELRLCRNYLLFRDHYAENRVTLSKMHSCKRTRLCPLCGIARANGHVTSYRLKIAQLVSEASAQGIHLHATFITLTKKHGVDFGRTYAEFAASVTKLVNRRRDAIRASEGSVKHSYALRSEMASITAGVFSFEAKRGKRSKLWNVHLHGIVLSTEPIDKFKLSAEWRSLTGDSYIVDVKPVASDDVKALCEVLKYALKFSEMTLADNLTAAMALQGKRLIRAFGDFHGLTPDDSADIDDTTVLDSPYVERLYRYTAGAYAMTRTGSPTPLLPLSVYGVDSSGSIITAATIPPPVPYRPATAFLASPLLNPAPLEQVIATPIPPLTMPEPIMPPPTMPEPIMPEPIMPPPPPITIFTDHHHEVQTMLRSGRFPIEKGTFTVDGQSYLLCQREHSTKAPTYYLLTLPGRGYLSALWPRAGGRFSLDYKGTDGVERVFEVDFSESGFIRLTDKGLSHRSLRPAPWQQGPRPRSGTK